MTATTRRRERDWWLLTLAVYGRRLGGVVRRILVRMGRRLEELPDLPLDALAVEVLTRLNRIRWAAELRREVADVLLAAVLVGATDELARHTPADADKQTRRRLVDDTRRRTDALLVFMLASAGWDRVIETVRVVAVRTVQRAGSPVVARRRVRELFRGAALTRRADRVGETEGHGAIAGGKEAARSVLYREGYLNAKQWRTRHDERVRHSHQDTEGQIVGIRERFVLEGGLAMYPGDPALPARERVGCRCWSVGLRLSSAEFEKRRHRRAVSERAMG